LQTQIPVNSSGEYTKDQVVQSVITHEMGHAVGIKGPAQNNGNCPNQGCIMYYKPDNWNTNLDFCEECREMILIHNN
jgi:predicted Zn-dependent protease